MSTQKRIIPVNEVQCKYRCVNHNGGYFLVSTIISGYKFSTRGSRGRCKTWDMNKVFGFGDQGLLMYYIKYSYGSVEVKGN